MKNVFYSLCFLAVLTMFSCSSSQSPGQVAVNFLTSIENGDIKKAKELSTEASSDMLSMLDTPAFKEELKKSTETSKTKYEVIDTKIDGDKATCKLKMMNGETDEGETELSLVKKDGKWLVDLNKEDMNKEELMEQEMLNQ